MYKSILGPTLQVLKLLWRTGLPQLVLVAAILIWTLAAFYTFTSNAFLNSFCEMKLPIVRNIVCSGYDSTMVQMQDRNSVTDFNTEFGTIFEDKNIGTAISLPYYLSEWQTEFRWLRANLPSSKLSVGDEQFFRDTLTESIDLNQNSVALSQKTFSHMLGTAEHIVSGSTLVLSFLNETGFTPGTGIGQPRDGLLTMGMEWLYSKNLVILPYGLEPFRESRNPGTISAITRMRIFIQGVIERLHKDQDGILALQGQLGDLIDLSERLTGEAIRCVSDENEAKVLRGYRGWYAFLNMIGHTDPEDWITRQRLQALESMKPIYKTQMAYLDTAKTQLGNVLQACGNFEENLFKQEAAAQWGMSRSDWLVGQPGVLEEGKVKLVKEISVWNMRKKEVNVKIFENFG